MNKKHKYIKSCLMFLLNSLYFIFLYSFCNRNLCDYSWNKSCKYHTNDATTNFCIERQWMNSFSYSFQEYTYLRIDSQRFYFVYPFSELSRICLPYSFCTVLRLLVWGLPFFLLLCEFQVKAVLGSHCSSASAYGRAIQTIFFWFQA
jgi:hypothetical protein